MMEPSAPERKLGEEWEDWDGTLDTGDASAPGWVFLVLAGVWVVILILAGFFTAWLIGPRFAALGVGFLAFWLAGIWTGYLLIWYTSILIALGFGSRRFQNVVKRLGGLRWMVSPAMNLGKLLGISRDRTSHAWMLIHNRLEVLPPLVQDPARLLVLVPRCLSRAIFQALAGLRKQYGFTQMTVGGGTEARRSIARLRPQGVLAVACERDLLSGIRELKGRVPVLAYANRRPEGPCQNTQLDLKEIEKGIHRFLD